MRPRMLLRCTPRCTLGGNTPTAAELGDFDGHDPGLGHVVLVNPSHSRTSRAVAQEADDFDGLAYLGKIPAGVLVELVDRVRVLHGEPDVVVTRHASTMARSRGSPQIARAIAAHSSAPKRSRGYSAASAAAAALEDDLDVCVYSPEPSRDDPLVRALAHGPHPTLRFVPHVELVL